MYHSVDYSTIAAPRHRPHQQLARLLISSTSTGTGHSYLCTTQLANRVCWELVVLPSFGKARASGVSRPTLFGDFYQVLVLYMLRCLGIQDTYLANRSGYNFGVIQSVQILEGELEKMQLLFLMTTA